MMGRARPGVTLLETLVAITLLVMLGLGVLRLARQSLDATISADRADKELRAASDFLNAVSLWSRTELDQRLGTRTQGHWALEIMRRTPDLYDVRLLDSTRTAVILATALYRPARLMETP